MNGELRRPNTEITGEEFKGKISPGLQKALGEQIWDLKNLSLKHEIIDLAKAAGFAHSTPENYKYDANKMDWQGWMLVGEFANTPADNPAVTTEYIKVAVD